jgi:large subunit ribosomal protein L6
MSRIGKMPITLPKGVEVKIDGSKVAVKGPKGSLTREIHDSVGIELANGVVTVTPKSPETQYGPRGFSGIC